MSWKDKCAVMAVWNHPEAAFLTYLGLYALQHRGQEGAGIVSLFEGRRRERKAPGLVGDVFSADQLRELRGRAAIGHTRYSTTGSGELKNIQPLTREIPGFGPVSVSHNGNIVNHRLLSSGGGQEKSEKTKGKKEGESDTECLFPLLSKELSKSGGSFSRALKSSLAAMEGAFSLAILTKDSLIAARDPLGFRPLVLGKKDGGFAVASETCAFDLTGARLIREIQPGEILTVGKSGLRSERLPPSNKKAQCIFEYVYFSRPDSMVFGQNVYERRKLMGALLAREHPAPADLVIPVPDSGVPAALGYARESGLPYEMGIVRNHYIGRTFIHPSPSVRNFRVKIKLSPISRLVRGKRVAAVDDSIVRGTTSRSLIEVLRQAGAREVHLRISSPPIKAPCYYGVDTPQKKQLISAASKNAEETRKSIGADSLAYLSEEALLKAAGGGRGDYCLACFDENYPTKIYADPAG